MDDLKEQVDRYIELVEQEKALYELHKTAKKNREALRDTLAPELDNRGIKRQLGTKESGVTVVTGDRNYVEDKFNYIEWCREHGLFEVLVKEEPNMTSLKNHLKEGGEIPAGVKMDSNLSLRVNKGMSKSKDFDTAAEGLLEQMGVFDELDRVSKSSDKG